MIEAQLHTLQDNINRKIQLETWLPKWKAEYEELAQLTATLHTAMLNEQSDVEKLEAGGLGTVIHKLTGRMEEKLDKERLEAETATNEYHEAESRLRETEAKISEAEKELESLRDSKSQYILIMQEQIDQLDGFLQNSNNQDQAETLKLQFQLARRRKSLREALLESGEADRAAEQNLETLQLMQEAAKVDTENQPVLGSQEEIFLQKAKFQAQQLVEEMSDLQAKLAQMGIDPAPHLSIGAYLKAPAAFLSGTASDAATSDQIHKAIAQIEEIQEQLSQIDEKLVQALTQIEARLIQWNE